MSSGHYVKTMIEALGRMIEEKKIRFVIGKINTGIQMNIPNNELHEIGLDVFQLQQILPAIYQICSSSINKERENALQIIKSLGVFNSVPSETVLDYINEVIVTDQFKRVFYHRVSTVGPVLDSMQAQFIMRQSQNVDISPDIPSIQYVLCTRGSTNIDDINEQVIELSVDDIDLMYNFFKEIRKTIQEKISGTIFQTQETSIDDSGTRLH